MALPGLAARGLAAGAAEVQFVGCPPEDCANREGNLWQQRRLERERLPKLGRAYTDAPIATDWLPPNDFRQALAAQTHQTAATAYDLKPGRAYLRNIVAAAGIMLAVMAGTVVLSRVPFQAYPASRSLIEISMRHVGGQPVRSEATGEIVVAASDAAQTPVRLALEVDGQVVWDQSYASGTPSGVFKQVALASEARRVRLLMYDMPGQFEPHVLSDQTLSLVGGQILPLHFSDAADRRRPGGGAQAVSSARAGGQHRLPHLSFAGAGGAPRGTSARRCGDTRDCSHSGNAGPRIPGSVDRGPGCVCG